MGKCIRVFITFTSNKKKNPVKSTNMNFRNVQVRPPQYYLGQSHGPKARLTSLSLSREQVKEVLPAMWDEIVEKSHILLGAYLVTIVPSFALKPTKTISKDTSPSPSPSPTPSKVDIRIPFFDDNKKNSTDILLDAIILILLVL